MFTAKRCLIVNADDFGRSPGVNCGIMQTHEHGIVTSASLMVRWPAAIEAAVYANEHPDLSLGLHVDISEMSWQKGAWVENYQVASEDDPRPVESEVLLQLEAFRRLTGKNPTHMDSHQHIHQNEPVRSILSEIADCLGIPLRGCSWQVQHCGDFYGQDPKGRSHPGFINVDGLNDILTRLGPGFTELSCHPGEAQNLDSMYRSERAREVNTLCDSRVKSKLAELDIELCSFNQLDSLLRHESIAQSLRFPDSRRSA